MIYDELLNVHHEAFLFKYCTLRLHMTHMSHKLIFMAEF